MTKPIVYVAVDVEANGPIPGPFSMLAFGSVAYNTRGDELSTFAANLMPLEGAAEDPATMVFWAENRDAWRVIREDLQDPMDAMRAYVEWLRKFKAHTIVITQPKGYDFMWLYWYMRKFGGKCPFGWEAIDLKSYVAGKLRISYKNATRLNLPQEWFEHARHTHVPLEDAKDLGQTWWKIMNKDRSVEKIEKINRELRRRQIVMPTTPPQAWDPQPEVGNYAENLIAGTGAWPR